MTDQTKPAAPVCDQIQAHSIASEKVCDHLTTEKAVREPDLMDGGRYTNTDIAKRMWESFNSTGDRWFKYAAQRLEANSDGQVIANQENLSRSQPEPSNPVVTQDYAGFIVRAVNSHDALVKALEQIKIVCLDNAASTVRHDLALDGCRYNISIRPMPRASDVGSSGKP